MACTRTITSRVGRGVEKIDFAKMEKVTRTVYATLLALADAPTRPKVDKSLPAQLQRLRTSGLSSLSFGLARM